MTDPPDGKIPYQPWAAARAKYVLDHHLDPTPDTLDPSTRCFLQGVPRAVLNREFEIERNVRFQCSVWTLPNNLAAIWQMRSNGIGGRCDKPWPRPSGIVTLQGFSQDLRQIDAAN